ncbi:MAG: hypothetical protein RL062_1170, partial [Bacteroidota bacterium]
MKKGLRPFFFFVSCHFNNLFGQFVAYCTFKNNYMRKRILQSSFVLGLASIFMFGVQSPNGKANYTGGHGESDCTDCHSSYAVNSGSGNITISCASMTNWQYVPGTSYTINVTIAHPSRSAYGIDFQALNSSNANAGTLTAGTGTHTSTSGGKTN